MQFQTFEICQEAVCIACPEHVPGKSSPNRLYIYIILTSCEGPAPNIEDA